MADDQLKFQCSTVICTPEFTLTCAGNGVSQDIPFILCFHYKSTSLLVSLLAVIGIFSFRDALGTGTWLICHRNTPSHIILNRDYLSSPRLYVPFHPAVYRISGEAAAREIKRFIRLFFILQITRSKDKFSSPSS